VMSSPPAPGVKAVVYPESDGKPMADNTIQARWIFVLFGNLTALFRESPDVFVAADLFWYAREGDEHERTAPDVLVVFGRPKGDRGSYKQWEEADVPVTVVFEVLSPSNTIQEMAKKLAFYDEYGVEEYYVFDPDENDLLVYTRGRAALRLIHHQGQYTSARLGIRFDLSGPEMAVFYSDGRRFLSFEELDAERLRQQQRADSEQQRADSEQQRADSEQRRADSEQQRADKAERELARLLELSRKVVLGQAAAEEVEELNRLVRRDSLPS
jgi:Uma2 family endonuclease